MNNVNGLLPPARAKEYSKTLTTAGIKQMLREFGKNNVPLTRQDLVQLLMQMLSTAVNPADVNSAEFVRRFESYLVLGYENPPGSGNYFHTNFPGYNAENLRFAQLGGQAPADASWDPLADNWLTGVGTADSNRQVWAGDNLVDTDTGKIWKYVYDYGGDLVATGSGVGNSFPNYDESYWTLMYDPSGQSVDITDSVEEPITIGARKFVQAIIIERTSVEASPTVTIEIDGGATLMTDVPFDNADSTVITLNYFSTVETVLNITTNCDATVTVHFKI